MSFAWTRKRPLRIMRKAAKRTRTRTHGQASSTRWADWGAAHTTPASVAMRRQ